MRGMKWGTVDSACEAFVQNVPAQPRVQTSCCILRHGIHVAPHIQLQLHCLYRDRTQFQFQFQTSITTNDATPQTSITTNDDGLTFILQIILKMVARVKNQPN